MWNEWIPHQILKSKPSKSRDLLVIVLQFLLFPKSLQNSIWHTSGLFFPMFSSVFSHVFHLPFNHWAPRRARSSALVPGRWRRTGGRHLRRCAAVLGATKTVGNKKYIYIWLFEVTYQSMNWWCFFVTLLMIWPFSIIPALLKNEKRERLIVGDLLETVDHVE